MTSLSLFSRPFSITLLQYDPKLFTILSQNSNLHSLGTVSIVKTRKKWVISATPHYLPGKRPGEEMHQGKITINQSDLLETLKREK
jgi:hypothetical protein